MTNASGPVAPPTASAPPATRRVWLVLAVALLAVSLAAIYIRLADAPGVVVALYRMAIAAAVMLPVTLRGLRRTPLRARTAWLTVAAGALLALHFASWISSLSFTSVAASVSLASTQPLWMALLAWLFLGTAPTLGVLVGVLLAVAGAATIGFGDMSGGTEPLLGDALALLGAVAGAGYILLGRAVQRLGVGLDAYAGTAYGVAALMLLPLPALFGHDYLGYPWATYGWIVLLALMPQLVGHTGINYAAKHLDPTVVATAMLLEPLGSGLLALLVFREVPSALTLVGAGILLVGVLLTLRSAREDRRPRGVRPGGAAARAAPSAAVVPTATESREPPE
ncbi:MAG: DMT family transporter [Trueperaceae bacterium]